VLSLLLFTANIYLWFIIRRLLAQWNEVLWIKGRSIIVLSISLFEFFVYQRNNNIMLFRASSDKPSEQSGLKEDPSSISLLSSKQEEDKFRNEMKCPYTSIILLIPSKASDSRVGAQLEI
jgi:hypothetical protein